MGLARGAGIGFVGNEDARDIDEQRSTLMPFQLPGLSEIPQDIKRWMPIGFAVAMGLLAVASLNRYLVTERRKLDQERQELLAYYEQHYQDPIDVVVAARDVAEDVSLSPGHLRMAKIPESFVQPYATLNPGSVLGMVTRVPIAEGEQIMQNKLRRPEDIRSGATLSTLTPEGKRAITIQVDTLTGVGGFVRPGDLVDILWTLKLPVRGQRQPQVVTLTLFQHVPVLAVGGTFIGGRTEVADKKGTAQTVTLALGPQETSFLLFAREQGGVQLSLRPRSEPASQVAVAPANFETLMLQLGMQSDAPQGQVFREVEVYKGLKRDVVAVPEDE